MILMCFSYLLLGGCVAFVKVLARETLTGDAMCKFVEGGKGKGTRLPRKACKPE